MKPTPILTAISLGAAALLTLSACSPRENGETAHTVAPVSAADLVAALPAGTTPVDQVTWSLTEGEPGTLDPVDSFQLITPNLCDNLLLLEPDFSVAPGLAVAAEWADPTTFVIDLRDDVAFWDGTPMTADDVVYSLDRHRDPESQWYVAFVLVTDIEKTGDHQVTVHFSAPDTTFRDALTGGAGAILSQAYGDKVGNALGTSDGGIMCTGPYKFEVGDWKPGSEIVTTANENYWGGAPLVKTLKYVFVTNGSTLTTALTNGDIDGAYNVPPASRSAFEQTGAGRLVIGPSTASYQFGTASSTGPMTNPKIREAFGYAIDRQQFIDTVLNGLGQTQKTIVPPFAFNKMTEHELYQEAYDALPEPQYDLDKAKQLVEESGADLSEAIVVAVPAGAKEFQQTAQIMQDAGKKIGVTVEINEMQPADFGAIFFDPASREGVDSLATTGVLDTPGVVSYPSLFMLPPDEGGAFNWSGFDNQQVIEHLQAARTANNESDAAKEYIAAQKIFAPLQLQIKLANAYHLTYLSNDLTGVTTSVAAYSRPWALDLGGQ